jgi:hypothetical protein
VNNKTLQSVTRWSWETPDGEFFVEADRGERYHLYHGKLKLGVFNSIKKCQGVVDATLQD